MAQLCQLLIVIQITSYFYLLYPNKAFGTELPTPIKVGYVEFPPIEYKNENHQPAGSFIEITKTVLKQAKIEHEFIFLPISRAYLYLKEGEIDLWPGLSGIPTLQNHVVESRSVPISITLSAWFIEGTPPIRDVNDLKGSKTILINGYTYGGLLYKITSTEFGMTSLYTTTHLSGLKMLERGRGNYLLDYNEPILSQIKTYPVRGLSNVALNTRQGSFVISKKTPNAEQLRDKLDNAYQQLIQNKKLQPFNHTLQQ